jgi:hypothetical protein
MTGRPELVYVLQVTHEDGWSTPDVHARLASAKKTARDMWRQSQHDDELSWTTDDEGDRLYADPRAGVRFVICSGLVHP